MYKNDLIRMIRLISKFMTSQHGKQVIAIHIFPNISRSKYNQTMKFGQLTKYNMRNCFLEKLYTKKKLFPERFLKNLTASFSRRFLKKNILLTDQYSIN